MASSAFSPDLKYFCQIGGDGRCRVWDAASGLLQHEYTPDLHLGAPLSCLHWLQLDGATGTPRWKNRKRKSSRPDESQDGGSACIVFGSTSGKVLVYSLARAAVESVLEDSNSPGADITCVEWSRQCGLYTCSVDSTIRKWSIEEACVKEKFRMNKYDKGLQARTTAIRVINDYQCSGDSSSQLLLTAACQIRLWCLKSKRVLRTLTGHSSDVCHLKALVMDDRLMVLSGSKNDRILSYWTVTVAPEELSVASLDDSVCIVEDAEDLPSKKTRRRRSKTADPTETSGGSLLMEEVALQVACRGAGGSLRVAAVTRSGVVHYYEHTLNGSSSKPVKPSTTIQVAMEEASGAVKPALITCGDISNEQLLIGYSKGVAMTFERLTPNLKEKTQVLIRTPAEKETKKESVKKQSEGITKLRTGGSGDPSVVHLSSTTTNLQGSKRGIDAKQEVPMESRLANLSLAKSGGTPNKASQPTSNMAQLLVQALHSKDAKLLSTVFECTDPEVAFNSINRLPIQYMSPLLDHLTDLLAGRTNQCRSACVWAAALCRARSSALLALGGGARALLGSLAARRPALPALLQLRGRLALATRSAHVTSGQSPTALLQYEDSSSDDEIGGDDVEEALMNNASADDSASWHEDDDDDNDSSDPDEELEEEQEDQDMSDA